MQKNTFRALFSGLILGAYVDWGVLCVDLLKGFNFTADLIVETVKPNEVVQEVHTQNVTAQSSVYNISTTNTTKETQ